MEQPLCTVTFPVESVTWRDAQYSYLRTIMPGYAWLWIAGSALSGIVPTSATLILVSALLSQLDRPPLELSWAGLALIATASIVITVALDWMLVTPLRLRVHDFGLGNRFEDEPLTVDFFQSSLCWRQSSWSGRANYDALSGIVETAGGMVLGLRSVMVFVPFSAFNGAAQVREIRDRIAAGLSDVAKARSKAFLEGISS